MIEIIFIIMLSASAISNIVLWGVVVNLKERVDSLGTPINAEDSLKSIDSKISNTLKLMDKTIDKAIIKLNETATRQNRKIARMKRILNNFYWILPIKDKIDKIDSKDKTV